MSARPRNRYVTLGMFLCAVIFAGFAVQRYMEIKLTGSLEEPAFPEAGDVEAQLRGAFNKTAGGVRIIVPLSAGSLSSEQDVDALRRLLRENRRAKIHILAVWRGPEPLRAHTTRFGDGRVLHFWDPDSRVLPETLEGTVMVHRAGAQWVDEIPPPSERGEPARAVLPLLRRVLAAAS